MTPPYPEGQSITTTPPKKGGRELTTLLKGGVGGFYIRLLKKSPLQLPLNLKVEAPSPKYWLVGYLCGVKIFKIKQK